MKILLNIDTILSNSGGIGIYTKFLLRGLMTDERIKELIDFKKETFNKYKNLLKELPLKINPCQEECQNGYWMPTIVFNENIKISSLDLIRYLDKYNIDARVFFWPLSSTSIPGEKANNEIFISESIHQRALNLPSSFDISDEDINLVCSLHIL